MDWWEKLYRTNDYLLIFSPYLDSTRTFQQVEFIQKNLPLHHNDHILDLCCGTGRHSLELARRGYHVVGFDWSSNYLEIARQHAKEENSSAEFVQGDMRNLCFGREFNVVLSMFTSFGYFDDDVTNECVIQQIAQVLKSGGLFFFDFINLESLIKFPSPVIWHHDPASGVIAIRERSLDLFKWRMHEKCLLFAGNLIKEHHISYRLYSLAEFSNMLHRYGLRFRNAFGDFDGRDICENSPPRMIIIAVKE